MVDGPVAAHARLPVTAMLADVTAPDLTIWPLLDALRIATAAQLGVLDRPVCHFPIYAADHLLPADTCNCTCQFADGGSGEGTAWVRMITANTMLNLTGLHHVPRPCGGGELMVTVEIGIYRCAPTLDQQTLTVDPVQVDQYARGANLDAIALHRAFACNQWLSDQDSDWQITQLQHYGPAGGCTATVVQAQVMRRACCPVILAIGWTPDLDDMLTVDITITGHGDSGAWLDTGDQTGLIHVTRRNQPIRHQFPAPGTYTLTAVDAEDHNARATAIVVVKDHAPRATVFLASDDDWNVLLWLDEPADTTRYLVTWGDEYPPEEILGQRALNSRAPARVRVPHAYQRTGQWDITVRDLDSRRQTMLELSTGEIGVVFVFDQGSYRPRAQAAWFATGARYEIDWGDGTPTQRGPISATGRINVLKDLPMAAGTYQVLIREILDGQPRRYTLRELVIPSQWDWRLDVWTAWRRDQVEQVDRQDDEPVIQTIRVRARDARVNCVVDWGDDTPQETMPPGVTLAHDYTLPMSADGLLLRVVEDAALLPSGTEPRVFSRLLGEPVYIGQPVLAAGGVGEVILFVAGIAGLTNSDWYQISWGERDSAVEPVAAIGAWYPADHTYGAPGTYTITVDGPGMREPITRQVTVSIYPSPVVNAIEDLAAGDPDHLTSLITINNRASGGPVLFYPGDGTEPTELPETATVSHRYPDLGANSPMTYWPLAISQADPTAKGRQPVTVPYPTSPPNTLELQVDPAGPLPTFTVAATAVRGDPGKLLMVDWGDGAMQAIVINVAVEHTYGQPGTYTISLFYEHDTESVAQDITIPITEAP